MMREIPEDIYLTPFLNTIRASSEVEELVKEKGVVTFKEVEKITRKYNVLASDLFDMLERISGLRIDYEKEVITE